MNGGTRVPGAGRDVRAPRAGRRVWSVRRGPAALLALLGLVCCAALLAPRAARRLGCELPPWAGGLTGRLPELRTADGWVVAGGAALAVAGAVMVVLALTPGARREVTLEPPLPGVRACLDRHGVGTLLRDTALRVPGVSGARVRVRRRRAVVRAVLAFGDPAEAREALTAALGARRDRLGLARPPALVVRIAPADRQAP